MKKLVITKNEAGMKLHKYLEKIFVNMPKGTLEKLIRKKYFEINGKKANGQEILDFNDTLAIFLSDDTFNKFIQIDKIVADNLSDDYDDIKIKRRIIYEDDNIILYNKEVGLLSQSNVKNGISVNSVLNHYLYKKNIDNVFRSSVVNRLDRNTSGIIIFAKTYIAAKSISHMIKTGNIDKHYLVRVNGNVKEDTKRLSHLLKKDSRTNKVEIKDYAGHIVKGYVKVECIYKVLKRYENMTVLDVKLLTGKSHQIRAQFSYIGHPLIGDKKYMNYELYQSNLKKYNKKYQDLICYKIRFGTFNDENLSYLDNKEFTLGKEYYEI